MPLQSKIFRGDRALDACLVDDKAHIVQGSRGPHVRKLQQALAVLDGALIGLDEVSSELYGASTAAAVLNYKRARKIINFSYQTTADNIVGKMTIATLDGEMLKGEARPPLRGCLDETRPSGASGGAAIGTGNASGFAEGAPGNARSPQPFKSERFAQKRQRIRRNGRLFLLARCMTGADVETSQQ